MTEKRDVQWYLDRGLVVPGSGEEVTPQEHEVRLAGETFAKTHGEASTICRCEAEANVLTADVALRQRERDKMRIEVEVAKASETAPAFQRLYDLVKMRENEKSPLRGTNSKGLNSKGY